MSVETASMLTGTLALGEVESVEMFCRSVLDDQLRATGGYLNATEYEDALSYLIADAWLLWQRYDPAKGTKSFSTYAYRILRRRVASWYRQRFVDSRYQQKPVWVELDDDDEAAEWERDDLHDLYERVNVDRLSPEGRLVFEKIARPMIEGDMTREEIAAKLGHTRRWVTRKLDELRSQRLELAM